MSDTNRRGGQLERRLRSGLGRERGEKGEREREKQRERERDRDREREKRERDLRSSMPIHCPSIAFSTVGILTRIEVDASSLE